MTWNHRFILINDEFSESGSLIELAEVYYDQDGKPEAYGRPSMLFDDEQGIEDFIERIQQALKKPFLTVEDFPDPIHDPLYDFDYEDEDDVDYKTTPPKK